MLNSILFIVNNFLNIFPLYYIHRNIFTIGLAFPQWIKVLATALHLALCIKERAPQRVPAQVHCTELPVFVAAPPLPLVCATPRLCMRFVSALLSSLFCSRLFSAPVSVSSPSLVCRSRLQYLSQSHSNLRSVPVFNVDTTAALHVGDLKRVCRPLHQHTSTRFLFWALDSPRKALCVLIVLQYFEPVDRLQNSKTSTELVFRSSYRDLVKVRDKLPHTWTFGQSGARKTKTNQHGRLREARAPDE